MKRLFSKISDMRETIILMIVLAFYCTVVYLFKLPCPIYFFTGVSCPGCGMTRAFFALLHFDFDAALYYHPLIFFCIFAFLILAVVHIKKKYLAKKILIAVFVVTFIVTYLYRLLILKSPILYFSPGNGIIVKLLKCCFN